MNPVQLDTFLNTVDVSRVQQILIDLVQLKSENPGGTEQQVADYCKVFLAKLGYEVSFVELMPERNNVIALSLTTVLSIKATRMYPPLSTFKKARLFSMPLFLPLFIMLCAKFFKVSSVCTPDIPFFTSRISPS